MNTLLVKTCCILFLCGTLSSCAYVADETTTNYTDTQPDYKSNPYSYYQERSPYEGYGHPTNSIYFGHDAAIGYGGVNVYGYQGV